MLWIGIGWIIIDCLAAPVLFKRIASPCHAKAREKTRGSGCTAAGFAFVGMLVIAYGHDELERPAARTKGAGASATSPRRSRSVCPDQEACPLQRRRLTGVDQLPTGGQGLGDQRRGDAEEHVEETR